MAFQPFCVGTVTWTFTGPFASRTGRITPGMIERISSRATSRSSTGRRSSRIECSILSFPLAVRRRKDMVRILLYVAYRITLIPGDGIGPEVALATVRAVEATGVTVEWDRVDAGVDAERATGSYLPEAVYESLERTRVGLK